MPFLLPKVPYKYIATGGNVVMALIAIFVSFSYTNPSKNECFKELEVTKRLEQANQVILSIIFFPALIFVKATKKQTNTSNGANSILSVSGSWGTFFNEWISYNVVKCGICLIIISVSISSDNGDHSDQELRANTLTLINLISYLISSHVFNNFFDNICNLVKSVAPEATVLQNANTRRYIWTQVITFVFSVLLLVHRFYGRILGDHATPVIGAIIGFRIASEFLFLKYFVKLIILFQINTYAFIKALVGLKIESATKDLENDIRSDQIQQKFNFNFSSIYFELSRIGDLIKMIATTIFISIVLSVNLILVLFVPTEFGNYYVYFFLKIALNVLPIVYLYTYRYQRKIGTKLNAVATARNISIKFLFILTIFTMCFVGTHRGCAKLVSVGTEDQKKNSSIQFAFYAVKTMALNTTVSFAMACLTSPGMGSWLTNGIYFQCLFLPTIWPTPFIMQSLHQAFGLNFLFGGGMHGLLWIFIFSLRIVEYGSTGTIFASISGALMLILGTKLMWPPGVPIPSAFHLPDWKIVRRLEAFLKDSKYGSYHVYFAFFVLCLYCVHASLIVKFFYSPYFLFAAVSYMILRLVHPSSAQLRKELTMQSASEQYQILSISARELRKNGVQDVIIKAKPPHYLRMANFSSTYSDIIMLRNMITSLTWITETVHYFSVVGISVVYPDKDNTESCIEVKLLISPTRRQDGITKLLVKSKDVKNGEFKLSMTWLVKSACQAAVYSPNVIAFGFESGAAAFCSLLLERSKMRKYINSLCATTQNNLIDLCVVWLSFKPPSRKQVTAAEIAAAVKEMSLLQEYLYKNSGGAGVKLLFIASGVPQEWTPTHECLAQKTIALEEDVAKELGVNLELVKEQGWGMLADKDKPKVNNEAAPKDMVVIDDVDDLDGEEEKDPFFSLRRNSEMFTGSEFVSSTPKEEVEVRSSVTPNQIVRASLQPNPLHAIEKRKSNAARSSTVNQHTFARASVMEGGPRSTLANISHHFGKPPVETKTTTQVAKENKKSDIKEEDTAVKTIIQIQGHEDSWVPMRHAMCSPWREFLSTLERRVNRSINWMCEPNGPDYTTLFITEHRSDVNMLKEFRYAEIYNEINRIVISEQLKYCKNPSNYLAGKFGDDKDPENSEQTACSVLYSGDFSSAKKDQLFGVVELVLDAEKKKKKPAYLQLIPDG